MKKRISLKFIVPISAIVLLIAVITGVFVTNMQIDALEDRVSQEITLTDKQIIGSMNLLHSSIIDQLEASISIFKQKSYALGTPSRSGSVNLTNQNHPNLLFGSAAQALNYNLVDDLTSHFNNSTATLFVKSSDEYVRIATNVKKDDGSRAIGTTLNKAGAAYQAISKGESYYGMVDILGSKYLTAYEPIKTSTGEVIGIWYVGFPLTALTAIGEEIKKIRILNNGFVALIDDGGKVLFHTEAVSQDEINSIISAGDMNKDWSITNSMHEDMGLKLAIAYPISDITGTRNSIITTIAIGTIVVFLAIMLSLYYITDRTIVKPINQLKDASNKLSEGNLNFVIDINSQDEIGVLANSFKQMTASIKSMSEEVGKLIESATQGKLDRRGDPKELQGEFRNIIIGTNKTLDAIIAPLNVAAEYIDRVSKGDIPPPIIDEYKGDFNEIKNNINQLIDSINFVVSDIYRVSESQSKGDIDAYVDINKHHGAYRDMVKGYNEALKGLHTSIGKILNIMNEYGKGNLDARLEPLPGKQVIANNAADSLRNNLLGLIGELNGIISHTNEGELSYRGNYGKYEGAYKDIVEGFNKVLDTIITPLNVAAEYVDRISKGDLPAKITEEYKGDFNEIKNNINLMIDSIGSLIPEIQNAVESVQKGNLQRRISYGSFQGAFKNILVELNNMSDSIQKPINEISTLINKLSVYDTSYSINQEFEGQWDDLKQSGSNIKERFVKLEEFFECLSNGDMSLLPSIKEQGKFSANDKVVPAAIKMMEAIVRLIDDANAIADSAIEGKLDKRADLSKHNGDYRKVVEGFNRTLDAVISPLNVAAEYIDRISKGDMPPKITDDYKGDFNEIKNNINQCIDAVKLLISEANMLAEAAEEGRLHIRADAKLHLGDYRRIIEGVNNTLDNFTGMINQIPGMLYRCKNDSAFSMVFVSDGASNLTGYTGKEIREKYNGVTYGGMIEQKYKKLVDDTIDNAIANRKDFKLNYKIIDRDGKHRWVWEQGHGIFDKDGKLIAIEGYVMDVNEQKTLEMKVQKSADYQAKNVAIINENLKKIADGDLNMNLTLAETDEDTIHLKETFEIMTKALNDTATSLQSLVDDATDLSRSAIDGILSKRADADKHKGEYRSIIEGVNDTLDAVVNPLKVSADYFRRISNGDIPEKLTQNYKGDFNQIKISLNNCIDAINLVISDVNLLAEAAVEGKLDQRADETLHNGEFKTIVVGFNETLNAMIEPMEKSISVMEAMSDGNLTARMHGDYLGEHKRLQDSINGLSDKLSVLIKQILDSVETTASAAIEISSTADTMSTSSHEQSAQAEEVASAVEEMSKTINENAINSSHTSDVAKKNGNIAQEGGKVVAQTVEKMKQIANFVNDSASNMERLGQSSKKIGEIISVIDDIADQTNLLALNAAIEAARAGEQGRGFAVVADEVRKLAERTTEATKQIADMIQGIQKDTQSAVIVMQKGNTEVNDGIVLADRAGESLKQIVSSSNELLDLINQIASASNQQAATSEEITRNVSAISQVTTESASRIQEVANSSEDLSRLTEELRKLVEYFKIDLAATSYEMQTKSIKSNSSKKLPRSTNY